ncbi:MAG: hypothetical protein Q9182_002717 [Xanthomendoza sp. 2 TL-2023]
MRSLLTLVFAPLLFSCGYSAPQREAGSPAQVAAEPTSTSESTRSGDLKALGHGGYICLYKTTFPLPDQWKSFDELEKINEFGSKGSDIIKAIQTFTTSPTPNLDTEQFQSLILAMVAQESGGAGNVVGDAGLSSGLLQVQLRNKTEKAVTCDPNSCTQDQIVKMLQQGIYGHIGTTAAAEAPGIAYWLGRESTGPSLRLYNSGSLPDRGDYSKLPDEKGTQSYVSDIGNRLSGVAHKGFPGEQWLQQMCGFQPAKKQPTPQQ